MRRWGILVGLVTLFCHGPKMAQAIFIYQPDEGAVSPNIYFSWAQGERAEILSTTERQTIQPNYQYRALFTPNDPQFSQQWNFQALNMTAAWEADQSEPLYGGDPAVLIAVLDTGLAYENYLGYVASSEIPNSRVWTNPAEIADGIDNDGNGLVDDLRGWDFVNADSHPNDDHGHGTHISNTILGQTNNSVGVAGLAWHSTILPLKVLDAAGNGTTSTITAAVNYAVAAGADIINLSLGGNNDDPILRQAIQTAISRGVIVIAAAGNDGAATLNYPARYDEVLAVGAIQPNNTRPGYSNYGSTLDLVAPGGIADGDAWHGIVQETCQTVNNCSVMSLVSYTGTSQAAAHAAGVAALLVACGAPGGSIGDVLRSTATDLGSAGIDNEYGAGLINAQAALAQAGCSLSLPVAPGAISAKSSATTTRAIRSGYPTPFTKPVFAWTGQSGSVYHVAWGKVGATVTTTTQTDARFAPTLDSQGVYQLTVRTIDGLNRVSEPQTFLYRFRRITLALGIGGNDSTIRLADTLGTTVRTFRTRLGSIPPALAGTVTKNQSTRLVMTGQNVATSARLLDAKGVQLATWKPLGSDLVGGVSAVGLRRVGQETLVASTGTARGATVRWSTLTGTRVRSIKVFANHDRGVTLASADVDGDGNDEVIVAKNGGSFLAAYSQSGQRLWQRQPLGKSWRGVWSLTAIDRNNDGRDEIAVGGLTSTGSTKIVIVGGSGGSLGSWTLRSSQGSGQVDLAAGDTNGNGTEELLSLPRTGRGVVDVWSPAGKRASSITAATASTNYRLTILE